MGYHKKHSQQIVLWNSSRFVTGLIIIAVFSFVALCYRGAGFLAVRISGSNIDDIIILMDEVSDSISVEDGVSGESSAQIQTKVNDALVVVKKSRSNRENIFIVRLVSPDLYRAEDELLESSVNYLESAEDLAINCSQGRDTWDDLEMLREKQNEYVNSREDYFAAESLIRRRFLLEL